jgi:hypothetical protein
MLQENKIGRETPRSESLFSIQNIYAINLRFIDNPLDTAYYFTFPSHSPKQNEGNF